MSGELSDPSYGACHGFAVVGADGPIGSVETPLFPPDCSDPDFLVVRVRAGGRARLLMVPTGLVERVDPSAGIVQMKRTRDDILALPDFGSRI